MASTPDPTCAAPQEGALDAARAACAGEGLDPHPDVVACIAEYRAFHDAIALDRQLRQAEAALGTARTRFARAGQLVSRARTAKTKLTEALVRALRSVGATDPYIAAVVRAVQQERQLLRNVGRYTVLPVRLGKQLRRKRLWRRRHKAVAVEGALGPAERAFIAASNACPSKEDVKRLQEAVTAAEGKHKAVKALLTLRNHKGLASTRLVGEALRTRIFTLSAVQQGAVARAVGGDGPGGRGTRRLVTTGKHIARLLPMPPATKATVEVALRTSGALSAVTESFLGGRELGVEGDGWDRGDRPRVPTDADA